MPSLVTLPYCRVVLFGAWDESPRRRFAAYRCRMPLPRLLGSAVVDEFATVSAPVFFCPPPLAGKIYDAGLTLAHRRSSELGIDQGWPPLVVALEGAVTAPPPELPPSWQEDLLEVIQDPGGNMSEESVDAFESRVVGADRVYWARFGEADVLVTDAPLLPKQLGRLCEASPRAFAIAVSEGQAIVASDGGEPRIVRAVSEERLAALVTSVGAMLAASP